MGLPDRIWLDARAFYNAEPESPTDEGAYYIRQNTTSSVTDYKQQARELVESRCRAWKGHEWIKFNPRFVEDLIDLITTALQSVADARDEKIAKLEAELDEARREIQHQDSYFDDPLQGNTKC